jgi:hypothetical protein
MTIRYPSGATEKTRRVINLTLGALLIGGFFSLEQASALEGREKYMIAGALAYMAAVSDGTVRILLAAICGLMLWGTLA